MKRKKRKKYFGIVAGAVDCPDEKYLIYLDVGIYKCDSNFVVQSIENALLKIGSSIKFLKLVLSDGVSYNMKARKDILKINSEIYRVSCFSHLIHNFSEKIQKHYITVTNFIMGKNDFLANNPGYNRFFTHINKPPGVCKTRWNTYLLACEYYFQNFDAIMIMILSSEFKTTCKRNEFIRNLVTQENKSLYLGIKEIVENYSFITTIVKRSERNGYSIEEAIKQKTCLNFLEDPVNLLPYLNSRWEDNDLSILEKMDKEFKDNDFFQKLLKCPSTSVDIERVFSKLEKLLSNGRNFKDDNVILYLSKFNLRGK